MIRIPRFRFSLRTLLIAIVAFCAVLALYIRFEPHVRFKAVESRDWSHVSPLPSKALIVAPADERVVNCTFGPVSFELPDSLAKNFRVDSPPLASIVFWDDERKLTFTLPKPNDELIEEDLAEFPEQSSWTWPRIKMAIYEAGSSDFSFFMSHQELNWHKWLLNNRSIIDNDVMSMEYLWRPDIEVALQLRPRMFEAISDWSTVDRRATGTMFFWDSLERDANWIRRACESLVIDGEVNFRSLSNAEIKSMVKFSPKE